MQGWENIFCFPEYVHICHIFHMCTHENVWKYVDFHTFSHISTHIYVCTYFEKTPYSGFPNPESMDLLLDLKLIYGFIVGFKINRWIYLRI